MSKPPRRRRSLTHVGGAIDTEGNQPDAERLAHALAVAPATDSDDDPARGHVHGFHTYPARLHPVTAARLVAAFAPAGGRVLDPFCGSGTVLVESLILGRRPLGVDLNPLAIMLARCKSRLRGRAELGRLVAAAKSCAGGAEPRRRGRADPSRRFTAEDARLFEPHVLRELDSVRAEIEAVRDDGARADLQLVLSSLLVKRSRRLGDTSQALTAR